jgi:hypothetical protein
MAWVGQVFAFKDLPSYTHHAGTRALSISGNPPEGDKRAPVS